MPAWRSRTMSCRTAAAAAPKMRSGESEARTWGATTHRGKRKTHHTRTIRSRTRGNSRRRTRTKRRSCLVRSRTCSGTKRFWRGRARRGLRRRSRKRTDIAAVVAATRVVVHARERLKAAPRYLKASKQVSAEAFLLAQPGAKRSRLCPRTRDTRVNLLKTDVAACGASSRRFSSASDPRPARPRPAGVPARVRPARPPDGPGRAADPAGQELVLPGGAGPETGVGRAGLLRGAEQNHAPRRARRPEGRVLAFDADARRLRRRENCAHAGAMDRAAPIVVPERGDFLEINPPIRSSRSCGACCWTRAARGQTPQDYLSRPPGRGRRRGGDRARAPGPRRRCARLRPRRSGSSLQKRENENRNGEKAEDELLPPRVAAARVSRRWLGSRRRRCAKRSPSSPSASPTACSCAPRRERVVAAVRPGPAAGLRARARPAGVAPTRFAGDACATPGRMRSSADQFEDDCEGFFVALFSRPTPPGAEKAAAAAVAAETKAPGTSRRRGRRARRLDGSGGVRPCTAGGQATQKSRRPCFGDSEAGGE